MSSSVIVLSLPGAILQYPRELVQDLSFVRKASDYSELLLLMLDVATGQEQISLVNLVALMDFHYPVS
jgi:hypothetical protein